MMTSSLRNDWVVTSFPGLPDQFLVEPVHQVFLIPERQLMTGSAAVTRWQRLPAALIAQHGKFTSGHENNFM